METSSSVDFTTYYVVFKQRLTPSLYKHYPNPFLIKERRKSENLTKIVFLDFGTTVRHTSQKHVRKHKDPITGNSFISFKCQSIRLKVTTLQQNIAKQMKKNVTVHVGPR